MKKSTYRIDYSPEAVDHLAGLTARQSAPVRVHYDFVDEPERVVVVKAVGIKDRNRVRIGGEEVELLKTVELAEANAPLSEYAREATKQTLVVTRKGKPILALMRLPPDTDLENLAVTTHPTFQAIVQRADARYQTEGGLSTEQVRRRLVARRAARRKR